MYFDALNDTLYSRNREKSSQKDEIWNFNNFKEMLQHSIKAP
jgi:hypothetical protein